MEKLEMKGMRIVELYLEKLEKLNDDERRVLIRTIDLLNHPIFITPQ